jgi:hypothetical protein
MSQIKETTCKYTKCKSCQILFANGLLTRESTFSLERVNPNTTNEDLNEVIKTIRSNRSSKKFENVESATLVFRNEMLDWIRMVCLKLNLYDSTYFTAVDIFDEVLDRFNSSLSNDDLLLIAITCIFISSKIEETTPLPLAWITDNLGQNKFEKDDYLMTELLILKTINFKIPRNYFLDFVNCIMRMILPTIGCACTDFIYNYIKNVYIIALHDLSSFRGTDVISNYFSIIYQSLLVMNSITAFGVTTRLTNIMKNNNVNLDESRTDSNRLSYINNASMAYYG